ncbi:MAG: ATP-binding cassette domain-containing protein, partial [Clostridium sp.]|nr:ATP-binding cassette domain-containing protein [Clostridium sp.]
MLEIHSLTKSFGKKEVLHNISCNLENGIYGLLGPNGAGKTTFLRCTLGLCPYKNGKVLLNGKDTTRQKKTLKIGYLPQKNSVFSGLTAEEHLRYFSTLKNIKKEKMQECIDEVLEKVHLTEQQKTMGNHLSGGMVRRLGVAQALLDHPDLIILDEPTTGLDPEERMRFKNIIKSIKEETIVIMSTHIVEDVEAVCNHIIVMKDGKFVVQGTPMEISLLAQGKVYEVTRDKVSQEDYIEKEKEVAGKEVLRILSSRKRESEKPVPPNVEDGYLCVLKDI